MKEKRSKKPKIIDDGRTVARMDIEGMPGYERYARKRERENLEEKKSGDGTAKPEEEQLILTPGEKSAMKRAAIILGVQVAFTAGGVFTFMFLIVWLWMKLAS